MTPVCSQTSLDGSFNLHVVNDLPGNKKISFRTGALLSNSVVEIAANNNIIQQIGKITTQQSSTILRITPQIIDFIHSNQIYLHFSDIQSAHKKVKSSLNYDIPFVNINYVVWNPYPEYLHPPSHSGSDTIVIGLYNANSNDTLLNMPSLVLHEYGHHVQQKVYEKQGTYLPPCSKHTFVSTTSDSCAWAEGWAWFFALWILDSSQILTGFSFDPINFEKNKYLFGKSTEKSFPSEDMKTSEGSVAATLWDIYDTTNESGDNISKGMSNIWKTFIDKKESDEKYPAISITEFVNDWNDNSYPSLDSVLKLNKINKIDNPPTINSIPNISLKDSQTKKITVIASDKDNDSITLSLQSSPRFVSLSGNTITITPSTSDVGTYTVTVQATANGKTDTESFTVTVTKSTSRNNAPPVISPISNISLKDSQTLSFSIVATDKEDDFITLSLVTSPKFVTLTGNTISINPTSSDVGIYTVTVQAVSNGKTDTESFTVTVSKTVVDTAPVISEIADISMTDSQTRTVTVTATDADGDTISLSLQSAHRFVSISGNIITVKPSTSDVGTHTVTVKATANGKTDTESFTVTVSQTIIDSPPVLTPQPDITINHTETKTLAVTATDPDGDAITVSLASYTPDFVTIQSISANSTILIKPALSDVGTHNVGIYADANGKRAVDVFKITILEEIIDAAPVISAIPNVSMFDSHTRAVTVTASDREGDTITLSLQSSPDFVTLSDNIIAIKPAKTDIGTYTVTVQATANGKSDTQSFKVIVAKRVTFDTGPVMQTVPDITMIHTQTETLAVTVTDKENDIITMSLARYTPDFVTLLDKGGGKGTITINPDSSDVGVHYVGVFAYANGLFAGNTVRVAVTNVPADTVPPVFSNIPADIIQSTSSNKTLVTFVPPTATDDTDGTIQVISSHKSGILFPIGNTTVTFTATDSAGNSATHNMTITITKIPPAAPPTVLFHDTFDGTLDSWTYKEIPYTPWIKTDCDTQNNNAYTLLYSTEHNGSAHINYTTQCWFGMAGANKTITIPESQKDYYLQISLDHRSLADMRHYANVGNVNNHFMSITDSDGLIIQYVTLFQGESHDTIQDTAWRQKSIMLSPTDIARCPCDVFVYVSDYWRIPWKQQGYIDNVEMKFVQGVTGAVPETPNSLTIDEFTKAVFANGTKIAITGKYVTDDTVLVSWEAFADATQYKAVITPIDTQTKTIHKKITNTHYEFTELEPDTAYTIKVMVADYPSTKSVITATTLGR